MKRYVDYDRFAEVYNRHWGGFAIEILPVLDRLLLDDLGSGALIIDLCCGTGQLAAALTEKGYRVIGVDGSGEMIGLARLNAPLADFIVEDARSFSSPELAEAVVSTYDSLNHLMALTELEQVFVRVGEVLVDGGVFVFDLNTDTGFLARWRGSFSIVTDDEMIVARSAFDPGSLIGSMDFNLMTREGEHWSRDDVSLTQRCYSEAEVRAALSNTGFEDVEMVDARDMGMNTEGRAFFRCRKASRSKE